MKRLWWIISNPDEWVENWGYKTKKRFVISVVAFYTFLAILTWGGFVK